MDVPNPDGTTTNVELTANGGNPIVNGKEVPATGENVVIDNKTTANNNGETTTIKHDNGDGTTTTTIVDNKTGEVKDKSTTVTTGTTTGTVTPSTGGNNTNVVNPEEGSTTGSTSNNAGTETEIDRDMKPEMTANTNSTNSGQPTTVSAIDQDKLPQTDEAKSNAGIFGMIMLALSGLFLGFDKRRKEEDK